MEMVVVENAVCGNGNLDPGEQCDGSDLNGLSCSELGFSGGTLSCTGSCVFNTNGCTSGGGGFDGGDGTLTRGEEFVGLSPSSEVSWKDSYAGNALANVGDWLKGLFFE